MKKKGPKTSKDFENSVEFHKDLCAMWKAEAKRYKAALRKIIVKETIPANFGKPAWISPTGDIAREALAEYESSVGKGNECTTCGKWIGEKPCGCEEDK